MQLLLEMSGTAGIKRKPFACLMSPMQALVADHDKLRTENEKLTRAKNDAIKKAKVGTWWLFSLCTLQRAV